MSKVYNKIVQSNTEPSKNDIWLKDGQMKTFGKEGWKSVSGGVSEEDLKEIYIFDEKNINFEELKNALESHKVIYMKFSIYTILCSSINISDNYIRLEYMYGNINDEEKPDENNSVDFWYEIYKVYPDNTFDFYYGGSPSFITTGEGNKFLSDDGYYKTIDIASLQTKITALEERIAALEGATA